MLARYYRLPTNGRLSFCTVESGSLSHDNLEIYTTYSSLACATTRLMVRVCARLVLWEYQHTLSIVLKLFFLKLFLSTFLITRGELCVCT